jgi:putative NIF3 family GTP cyclohydrolase 1 type 2
MGVTVRQWWGAPTGVPLGVLGELTTPMSRADFVAKVNNELDTNARLLAQGTENVRTVAILSGDGTDYFAAVKALGADTYLTGETDHATYWSAADYGLNVIYAGHYATETVGVQALGKHLAEKFGVETRFFDFPTLM